MYKRKEKGTESGKIKRKYMRISLPAGECVSLKQLAVTGSDLIREAGIPEGPQVGVKLKELLSLVIEDPSRNTKRNIYCLQQNSNTLQESFIGWTMTVVRGIECERQMRFAA